MPIEWETLKRKLMLPLGKVRHYQEEARRRMILTLGGYDPVTVRFLCYRAGLLSEQTLTGSFSKEMKPLVRGSIKAVRVAIAKLNDPSSVTKRSIQEMEERIKWRSREPVVIACEIVGEARPVHLLAQDSGSAERVPVGGQ